MSLQLSELYRRFENLIRLGVIAEVDYVKKVIRVQTGELLSNWLPFPVEMGNNFKRWRPLRVGTQVVLACPSGDPAQAVVISMLYTQALDAPSTEPLEDLIQFDDGTLVKYSSQEQTLTIDCVKEIKISSAKNIELSAGQNFSIQAGQNFSVQAGQMINQTAGSSLSAQAPAINLQGPVSQSGGDLLSEKVSLQNHQHQSPETGALTSGPVK